ncbi:MAG: hypothetical protein CHACPFDD_00746 [Phycisphaerae bacterium]|nr:hypothetical protein [Phycisphaerae bacterium]
MAAADETRSCQECGATIYPEHLDKHTAGTWMGKLLCPHCLQEKKHLADAAFAPAAIAAEPLASAIALAAADQPAAAPAPRPIRAFGGAPIGRSVESAYQFRRPTLADPAMATRCRTFHCKLNDASISMMNQQLNEWVDAHDDVAIKFATSSVGVFEGKHADPNLIVTVFY